MLFVPVFSLLGCEDSAPPSATAAAAAVAQLGTTKSGTDTAADRLIKEL